MRAIGAAAGVAVAALGVFAFDAGPARAQRAEAVDTGRVAVYEARFRAGPAERQETCGIVVPLIVRLGDWPSQSRLRRLAEAAQACWNVEPSVLSAFALARIYEQTGDTQAADAAVAAAQSRFPSDPRLLSALAGRKARSGQLEEANRLLDQAIALGADADDPDRWKPLAEVLLDGDAVGPLRLRVYDEAWRRAGARRNRTDKVRVLNDRARILLEASRHAEALADVERALPLASDFDRPMSLWLRARAKKASGDLEGARADFAAAVAAQPSVAAVEQIERRIAASRTEPAECWIAALAAAGLNHGAERDTDAIMTAADACIAAGRRAMGLTLKAAERNRLADRAIALQFVDEAIAVDGAYAYAHVVRGQVLQGLRRNAEAGAALDRAVELEPGNAQRLLARATLRIALGDRTGARTDQERALALDPAFNIVAAYVHNLAALGDHRCALAAVDAAWPLSRLPSDRLQLSHGVNWGDAPREASYEEIFQMRPQLAREVNALPREDRACGHSMKWGAAFVF